MGTQLTGPVAIKNQKLTSDQLTSVLELRKQFRHAKTRDHQRGLSCASHDKHVPTFIGACAGILTDDQYRTAVGVAKTDSQKLRFEVNQLKNEIAEVQALLRDLQS